MEEAGRLIHKCFVSLNGSVPYARICYTINPTLTQILGLSHGPESETHGI